MVVVDAPGVVSDAVNGVGRDGHVLGNGRELLAEHVGKQLLFAPKVVVNAFFVDSSLRRDAFDRRSIRTMGGEQLHGGVENLLLGSFAVPRHQMPPRASNRLTTSIVILPTVPLQIGFSGAKVIANVTVGKALGDGKIRRFRRWVAPARKPLSRWTPSNLGLGGNGARSAFSGVFRN